MFSMPAHRKALLVEVKLEDGVHLRVCCAHASSVSPPHTTTPAPCMPRAARTSPSQRWHTWCVRAVV